MTLDHQRCALTTELRPLVGPLLTSKCLFLAYTLTLTGRTITAVSVSGKCDYVYYVYEYDHGTVSARRGQIKFG